MARSHALSGIAEMLGKRDDRTRRQRAERLNRQRWATREQLRLATVVWIERTYHGRRRHDALGRMTPIEFETPTRIAHGGPTAPTEPSQLKWGQFPFGACLRFLDVGQGAGRRLGVVAVTATAQPGWSLSESGGRHGGPHQGARICRQQWPV